MSVGFLGKGKEFRDQFLSWILFDHADVDLAETPEVSIAFVQFVDGPICNEEQFKRTEMLSQLRANPEAGSLTRWLAGSNRSDKSKTLDAAAQSSFSSLSRSSSRCSPSRRALDPLA